MRYRLRLRITETHIFFLFIVLLMNVSACKLANKDVRTIKIGLSHGKSHSFTQALERFADDLEEESNGKFRVKIFHSSQLGGEKEMQEMLAIGSLDISLSGIINTYEPLFSLFEMPYLYRDRDHVMKVNNGPVMEEVASSLKKNGIKLIGFYENGFRHISTSNTPIEKPSDLEGLLIRTPENPAQIETIKALGGIPTPMSFSELYTALLQGVVDGQENPLQNIWHGRLYEAQKYIAKTYHIYNSVYVITGLKFWNSLSEKDQALIEKLLKKSSEWQLSYMEDLDKELEAKMKKKGVIFTYPDKKAFEKACLPAYEALYEQFGPRSREIVEKIKNTR